MHCPRGGPRCRTACRPVAALLCRRQLSILCSLCCMDERCCCGGGGGGIGSMGGGPCPPIDRLVREPAAIQSMPPTPGSRRVCSRPGGSSCTAGRQAGRQIVNCEEPAPGPSGTILPCMPGYQARLAPPLLAGPAGPQLRPRAQARTCMPGSPTSCCRRSAMSPLLLPPRPSIREAWLAKPLPPPR